MSTQALIPSIPDCEPRWVQVKPGFVCKHAFSPGFLNCLSSNFQSQAHHNRSFCRAGAGDYEKNVFDIFYVRFHTTVYFINGVGMRGACTGGHPSSSPLRTLLLVTIGHLVNLLLNWRISSFYLQSKKLMLQIQRQKRQVEICLLNQAFPPPPEGASKVRWGG